MLGRSNGRDDSQTSGVLIQYLRDISEYLQECNFSKKAITMAAAILMLAGLLSAHYRERGTFIPTSAGTVRALDAMMTSLKDWGRSFVP